MGPYWLFDLRDTTLERGHCHCKGIYFEGGTYFKGGFCIILGKGFAALFRCPTDAV